jgi:hypothetical protein
VQLISEPEEKRKHSAKNNKETKRKEGKYQRWKKAV